MPGSLNWEDPDYEESDILPLRSEDRASTNLESPAFQKGKADATVANAATSARSLPSTPAAPPPAPGATPVEAPAPSPAPVPASEADTASVAQAAPQVAAVTEVGNVRDHIRPLEYPESYVPPTSQAKRFARDQEQRRIEDDRQGQQAVQNVNHGDPYQGTDGRWKKLHADPVTGAMQEIDLDSAGLYKTDPNTGEKLIRTSGGYVAIGSDEAAAERAKLLQDRRGLRLQHAETEQDETDIRAQLAPVRDQLKSYGKVPGQFESAIATLQKGIDPANPDPAAVQRLSALQDKYRQWKTANPDYTQAKQQFDDLQNQLNTVQGDKRSTARQILDSMTREDYIRRTGTLPPLASAPSTPQPNSSDLAPDLLARQAVTLASKEGLTQKVAAASLLKGAQEQGFKTVGGRDIGQALADMTPKDPGTLEDLVKSPDFKGMPDDQQRVDRLKQWVNDTVQFQRDANPKWTAKDEQDFRAQLVDRPGVLGIGSEIGTQLWSGVVDVLPQAVGSVLRQISGGMKLHDDDWASKLVTEQNEDIRKRGVSFQNVAGSELRKQITGLTSMPLSFISSLIGSAAGHATGEAIGTLGGAAAGAETGPGAAATGLTGRAAGAKLGEEAGAFVVTGAIFTLLTKDQFDEQARDYFLKHNPKGTEADWEKWRADNNVDKWGWFAGGAEGLSEGIGVVLDRGFARAATKIPTALLQKWGKTALGRGVSYVLPVVKALAGSYATEAIEETASGVAQQYASEQAGFSGKDEHQSVMEILHDQGLPGGFAGLFQTGIMGMHNLVAARFQNAPKVASASEIAARYIDQHGQRQALNGTIQAAADAGDAAGQARAQDSALTADDSLHATSTQLLGTMTPAAQKVTQQVVAPELDPQATQKALAENPTLHFATMEMGRALGDTYLSGDKQNALSNAQAATGTHPALGQVATDQMVGMKAIKDLRSVLNGGSIEDGKARALANLGLLEAVQDPDGSGAGQAVTRMKVTDDALPLLPPLLRKQIAATPERFHFTTTPGTPGNLVHSLVKAGQLRMAQAATGITQAPTVTRPGTGAEPPPLPAAKRGGEGVIGRQGDKVTSPPA